jgi:hypothetical protein
MKKFYPKINLLVYRFFLRKKQIHLFYLDEILKRIKESHFETKLRVRI